MSHEPEAENPQMAEEMVKMITPVLKTRRIPVKSPQRPTGRRNMAVASKKDVITQLSFTALSPKLFSMAGNAIFTEEMRKEPMNEVMATIARIEICFFVQSIKILFNLPKVGQR